MQIEARGYANNSRDARDSCGVVLGIQMTSHRRALEQGDSSLIPAARSCRMAAQLNHSARSSQELARRPPPWRLLRVRRNTPRTQGSMRRLAIKGIDFDVSEVTVFHLLRRAQPPCKQHGLHRIEECVRTC